MKRGGVFTIRTRYKNVRPFQNRNSQSLLKGSNSFIKLTLGYGR